MSSGRDWVVGGAAGSEMDKGRKMEGFIVLKRKKNEKGKGKLRSSQKNRRLVHRSYPVLLYQVKLGEGRGRFSKNQTNGASLLIHKGG